jgi:hypothetical protein
MESASRREVTMETQQIVRLAEITKRKADELFVELLAELQGRGIEVTAPMEEDAETVAATDPTLRGYDEPWAFGDTTLNGSWEKVDDPKGISYVWPDGNVDEYDPFVIYRGSGDYDGMLLALGYKSNGEVIGFVLFGNAASKRGITYWVLADDFDESNEKLSIIRGGGTTGRAGFGPSDSLPKAYDGFKTNMLRDRVAGKWNVQAMVAKTDDHETMLAHTALQARLRKLV